MPALGQLRQLSQLIQFSFLNAAQEPFGQFLWQLPAIV